MSNRVPPLLPRSAHGGPSSAVFTGLDFSVNSNPYGPNPVLLAAVKNASYAHYPDPTYLALRQKLADWQGVTPDEVAPSVGASDLLHRIARAFLPAGSRLVSLHQPFGELARAAALQRAEMTVLDRFPTILPSGTRVVYVGQPHNPTGRSSSSAELHHLAQTCTAANALLVLDLAYAPFLPSVPSLAPSAVHLYSPGKAHGLVGARPAYAVAPPDIIARLENLAPAWHLPAGTAAALAALPDAQEFLDQTLPLVYADATALAAALRNFGPVEHHGTPFMTLEVGNAPQVSLSLLARKIRVRDCTNYGFPTRIRVSTQGKEADTRLVAALQEVTYG